MFIYFRERKCGERERISIGCLPYVLNLGSNPTAFWCMAQCSNQLSHLARAFLFLLKCVRRISTWGLRRVGSWTLKPRKEMK